MSCFFFFLTEYRIIWNCLPSRKLEGLDRNSSTVTIMFIHHSATKGSSKLIANNTDLFILLYKNINNNLLTTCEAIRFFLMKF